MPHHDPRVDAYIDAAPDFARPILERIRADVHSACPEVSETIKWGFPNFVLDGKILASMAAFKAHCSMGFWQREGLSTKPGQAGMGDYGKLRLLDDLPSRPELRRRLWQAIELLRAGAKRAPSQRGPREVLAMPEDFAVALAANPAAQAQYAAFAPGKQRDYLEWVLEAKQATTRAKRIAQAVDWIAEGKARHWKYAAC